MDDLREERRWLLPYWSEVCFRLPGPWDHVKAGRVASWQALAIAERTHHLPQAAATYVDRHLRDFAVTCTCAQIDRLVGCRDAVEVAEPPAGNLDNTDLDRATSSK